MEKTVFFATLRTAVDHSHLWSSSLRGGDYWAGVSRRLHLLASDAADMTLIHGLGIYCALNKGEEVQAEALRATHAFTQSIRSIQSFSRDEDELLTEVCASLTHERDYRRGLTSRNILGTNPHLADILVAPVGSDRCARLHSHDAWTRESRARRRGYITAGSNRPGMSDLLGRDWSFRSEGLVGRVRHRARSIYSHEYPLLLKDWGKEAVRMALGHERTSSLIYEDGTFSALVAPTLAALSVAKRLHDPQPSKDDPTRVAYFPSLDKRTRGIRTVSSAGKYLTRYFATSNANAVAPVLTTSEIQELAEQWQQWHRPVTVHYKENTDPFGWTWVYSNERGFSSCMSAHQHYGNGPTAVRAYAYPGNGLRLAYITVDGDPDSEVTARCIVRDPSEFDLSPTSKCRSRVYGDARLAQALDAAGYPSRSLALLGVRMQAIECPAAAGAYYTPYVDAGTESGGGSLRVQLQYDDKEFLLTSRYDGVDTGGLYSTAWSVLTAEPCEDDDDGTRLCPSCGEFEYEGNFSEVILVSPGGYVGAEDWCQHCVDNHTVDAIVRADGRTDTACSEHCIDVDGLHSPLLDTLELRRVYGVVEDEDGNFTQDETVTVQVVLPFRLTERRLPEGCVRLDVVPADLPAGEWWARTCDVRYCPFTGKSLLSSSAVVSAYDAKRGMTMRIAEIPTDWMDRVQVDLRTSDAYYSSVAEVHPQYEVSWPTVAELVRGWDGLSVDERRSLKDALPMALRVLLSEAVQDAHIATSGAPEPLAA